MKTPEYCTQNNGDCQTCSLVNYGLDCRNNRVKSPAPAGTKRDRVVALGHWHKGPVTTDAVLAQVPQDVWDECPARIVAQVADAINKAYHAGRASTGAEVIDDNCVCINSLDRAIEWTEDGTVKFTGKEDNQ
jgi:hypothetical protein